jgi:hypothetical protein
VVIHKAYELYKFSLGKSLKKKASEINNNKNKCYKGNIQLSEYIILKCFQPKLGKLWKGTSK